MSKEIPLIGDNYVNDINKVNTKLKRLECRVCGRRNSRKMKLKICKGCGKEYFCSKKEEI